MNRWRHSRANSATSVQSLGNAGKPPGACSAARSQSAAASPISAERDQLLHVGLGVAVLRDEVGRRALARREFAQVPAGDHDIEDVRAWVGLDR